MYTVEDAVVRLADGPPNDDAFEVHAEIDGSRHIVLAVTLRE